ncbi:MAG: hypothetical protein ACJ8I9_08880 [Chthoniobacterales bacterium]
MMPRIVGLVTSVMWLLLLIASVAFSGPDGAISFRNPVALIGDAIIAVVAGVIVASAVYAARPRPWLALFLLLLSCIMVLPFAYGIWGYCSSLGSFTPVPRFGRNDQIYLAAAIIFTTLAVLWAVICVRLQDAGRQT